MHRLLTDVGWPYVAFAIVIIVLAAPTVLEWWRFELRLARRAHQMSAAHRRDQQAEAATSSPPPLLLVDLVDDLYEQGDTLGLTIMATALDATEKALERPTNVVPLHDEQVKR